MLQDTTFAAEKGYNGKMKTLKLDHGLARLIVDGGKTTTWRVHDDKDLSVDDQVELVDKVDLALKSSWVIIGVATIDQVVSKRLGDLDELEKGDYGYVSDEDMYETFRRYYGKNIGPETAVKIIHFHFKAHKTPKRFQPEAHYAVKVEEVKLYADGGSRGNPGPSASGFVIFNMDDSVVTKAGLYLGVTTNNQAEYIALKIGLEEATKLQAETVHVYLDSLLVINQMKGIFKVKNRDLWPIHEAIKGLTTRFKRVTFTHVPRELNKQADAMVNEILDAELKV